MGLWDSIVDTITGPSAMDELQERLSHLEQPDQDPDHILYERCEEAVAHNPDNFACIAKVHEQYGLQIVMFIDKAHDEVETFVQEVERTVEGDFEIIEVMSTTRIELTPATIAEIIQHKDNLDDLDPREFFDPMKAEKVFGL